MQGVGTSGTSVDASLKIEQLLRMMSDEEKPPAPPLRNTSNQGHNKVRHNNNNKVKRHLGFDFC